MPDLKPITALGAKIPQSLRLGNLTLEENASLALASLALRRGAKPPAGLRLPDIGKWSSMGALAAFWIGPDQWMIEAPGRADEDFAAELAGMAPGCSVTEQTDGFVVFEIRSASGEDLIRALMAKLVNIDAARFVPGSAARTGLEHMSVFVIRRARDHLAIAGMRSAAGTLWHALRTAATRLEEETA